MFTSGEPLLDPRTRSSRVSPFGPPGRWVRIPLSRRFCSWRNTRTIPWTFLPCEHILWSIYSNVFRDKAASILTRGKESRFSVSIVNAYDVMEEDVRRRGCFYICIATYTQHTHTHIHFIKIGFFFFLTDVRRNLNKSYVCARPLECVCLRQSKNQFLSEVFNRFFSLVRDMFVLVRSIYLSLRKKDTCVIGKHMCARL